MKRIAVLLTCHNRCPETLSCLEALSRSHVPEGCSLEVFLVDDGSSDGTEQAVRKFYPKVNVIKGGGNLYWNGGMRIAYAAAMEKDFDYYLWLNDDTLLYPQALETLLSTEEKVSSSHQSPCVIVGSSQEHSGGKCTYGGLVRVSEWNPIKYQLVIPADSPLPCDTMNGNCVLVSRAIARTLGNLDERFIHTIGDIDYGLRARMAGFKVFVSPGYAGTCIRDRGAHTLDDRSVGMRERLRWIRGEKGLPFPAWRIFTRRHCGLFWVIFWLWPYLKVFLTPLSGKKDGKYGQAA